MLSVSLIYVFKICLILDLFGFQCRLASQFTHLSVTELTQYSTQGDLLKPEAPVLLMDRLWLSSYSLDLVLSTLRKSVHLGPMSLVLCLCSCCCPTSALPRLKTCLIPLILSQVEFCHQRTLSMPECWQSDLCLQMDLPDTDCGFLSFFWVSVFCLQGCGPLDEL